MDTVTGICDVDRELGGQHGLGGMLIGTTDSHLSRASFESDKNVKPGQWNTPIIQAPLKERQQDRSLL